MKNTLSDLNNILFEELDKLSDDDLSGEKLDEEIKRARAMGAIGEKILYTGELQLKAMKHMDEYGYERKKTVPDMLEIKEDKNAK